MSEIPNTESFKVAALAVAWEIVQKTYVKDRYLGTGDEGFKKLTNAVYDGYKKILSAELEIGGVEIVKSPFDL